MELEYYAILTEIGTAAIANATVLGQKIALTQFAVGDGGGSYYRPTKEMTALKGEKWRGEINSYEIDSSNPDLINVKAVIPALIGGFTIREMGLFDKDGRLIAISNTPDSVKITTDSGAVKEMEMVMEFLVSNANIVSIQVNPTVSIATKEDIQKHNQSLNAHKEQFNEKVNTNLNNVARETLLQKMGNVTENLENIVGTTENTGGTTSAGTVMAKLNKLLTDWTSTRADKIDTINNTIGTTANTGGTASAGTVMAKLNKLLTDWTTARAGKIDTINTNAAKLTDTRVGYIDKLANFGTITDTGGTATAGTIMAKLNKLLTDWTTARAGKIDTINTNTSNLNTRLTSTRAGYLDKLANFGAVGDTGGTATAGTMMAKLNALITANSKGLKVKSVQHGYVEAVEINPATSKTRSITINSVNVNKSIMIINTYNPQASNDMMYPFAYWTKIILNSSNLVQSGKAYGSSDRLLYNGFSYWIIEFE